MVLLFISCRYICHNSLKNRFWKIPLRKVVCIILYIYVRTSIIIHLTVWEVYEENITLIRIRYHRALIFYSWPSQYILVILFNYDLLLLYIRENLHQRICLRMWSVAPRTEKGVHCAEAYRSVRVQHFNNKFPYFHKCLRIFQTCGNPALCTICVRENVRQSSVHNSAIHLSTRNWGDRQHGKRLWADGNLRFIFSTINMSLLLIMEKSD